jgi:CRP/FNR family cyclic AMP-dependent transcriptional regulator
MERGSQMVKDNQAMILKMVPLFHDLTAQELARVEEIVIQRFFNKKTVIFTEGSDKEAVFFIRDGLVKAFKTDTNGHEQIVSFLKTGDMFPHIGFFNKDPYPATTEAIVETHVLAIPITLFEQLLLATPTIAIKVLRVMGAKIKELQEKLQEFTGQDVNHRAVSFLLKLAEQHGEKKGNTV